MIFIYLFLAISFFTNLSAGNTSSSSGSLSTFEEAAIETAKKYETKNEFDVIGYLINERSLQKDSFNENKFSTLEKRLSIYESNLILIDAIKYLDSLPESSKKIKFLNDFAQDAPHPIFFLELAMEHAKQQEYEIAYAYRQIALIFAMGDLLCFNSEIREPLSEAICKLFLNYDCFLGDNVLENPSISTMFEIFSKSIEHFSKSLVPLHCSFKWLAAASSQIYIFNKEDKIKIYENFFNKLLSEFIEEVNINDTDSEILNKYLFLKEWHECALNIVGGLVLY